MSATIAAIEERGRGWIARAWQRRWVRVVARVAAVAVVLRVLLALALPYALDLAASTRGLACTYAELDLSLLGGKLELRDLVLRERGLATDDAGEPLLAVDFATLDVAMWKSLCAHPTVARAEIDGLRALVEVEADGRVRWVDVLGLDQPSVDDEQTDARQLDFTSPIQIEALRLHDVALHLRDRSVVPAFDATVVAELRLDDASREQHALELRATSRGLFDLARVEADVDGRERNLLAHVRAELSGLQVEPLRAHLTALGFTVPARELDLRCELEASAAPRADSADDCVARVELRAAELAADGELIAALDRLELLAGSLYFDVPSTVGLALAARAPGIAATIGVDGQAELSRNSIDAALALRAEGVTAARLAKPLAEVGVAPELESGRFSARVLLAGKLDQGRVEGRCELAQLSWADARELLALERVAVDGVLLDPAAELMRAATVDVAGTRLSARRDAAGTLHALGFAIAAPPAASSDAPSAPAATSKLPRIEIGHFAWHDNALDLADETLAPPLELAITDIGAEIEALVLGAASDEPARIRAWIAAAPLVDSLSLSGTLRSNPGALDVEAALALRGRGLHATALREQLAPLGIEPTLERGELEAELTARAREQGQALSVALELGKVAMRDGDEVLASLDRLSVSDAAIDGDAVQVARVELDGATLAARRDASGALHALGVSLRAGAQPTASEPTPAEDPWQSALASLAPLELPSIAIGELAARRVSASWRDEAVEPAVACAVDLRAIVNSLSTKADPTPMRFELAAAIPGVLGEAALLGELALAPGELDLRGTLEARGVQAGPLASYLPPGVALDVGDGRFETAFEVALGACAEGGRRARASLGPLSWVDGDRPLAALERAALVVKRADAQERVLELSEVSLAGLEFEVERATPTIWRALGIAIDTAATSASAPAEQVAPPPSARPRATAAITLALGALDLELARLALVDHTRGDARVVARGRVSTLEPLVLLSPQARELPPFDLALSASVESIADEIELELRAAPYRDPLELELSAAVRGIHGEPLLALAPELATMLDGRALVAGELSARATLELALARRGPTELDLGKPFSGALALEGLQFKAEADGPVLAGLEALRAEIARVDPASGEVRLSALELDRPIGRVRRTAEGIEACGLLLRLPIAPPQGETAAEAPASADAAGADVSIGRLTIAGLDFALRDDSVTPPVEVTLDALDLEVRKLSTRDLLAGKPLQFAGVIGAGKQALPVRDESDSLLEGIAGAAADALAGEGGGASALEQRPLFEELAFAGRVALAPELEGWATVDVAALELVPLRGLAQSFGLTIGDGVLDQALRVRFQGARGMSVDSRSTFSHLSLSEPAGGPIERYLSLPAPLDTVLFLIKDFEGEHKVPISFRMTEAGIGGGEIARAATGAAASVIATAVASSPLRLLGTVTDLFGLTGGEDPPPSADAVRLSFDAGATALPAAARAGLERLRAKLARDSDLVVALAHEFSAADMARAAQLSNPLLDDCRQLSLRLRRKKAELERERGELAAQARVQFALGEREAAAGSTGRVRALEAELGLTENALDRVHELLKPGAERKRDARTRTAALAIASDRIARVRQALLDLGLAPERIEVRQVRVKPVPGEGGGRVVLSPRERQ